MSVWTSFDGGLTLLAPLVAIGLALATRKVVPALAAGTVVAAWVAHEGAWVGDGGLSEAGRCLVGACEPSGAVARVTASVFEALSDRASQTITAFTLLVGAMVGVMSASGATRSLVHGVERLARGPRGAMVASWLAGFLVFFDDYANCLVVGSAMGPVCDRQGVSRAKLAYIVDSTAAPVASLALVSTWVGFEVGLLDEALASVGRPGEGFSLFVQALPYRFYGWFALALVGLLALSGRDFGPMLTAEREARGRRVGGVAPLAAEDVRLSFPVAVAPVAGLAVVTAGLMLSQGLSALETSPWEAPIHAWLAGADAYGAMLYGGGFGFVAASAVALGLGGVDLRGWWAAVLEGSGHVVGALVVLLLAWTLGNAIGATEAQAFLSGAVGSFLPPALLPATVFVVAALVAFSTGTSFGTMSILMPLVVPLGVELGAGAPGIVAGATAAVLAGSCLGDHASPISDTTVLSAAGAQADLIEHVRTQLPYALTAGAVSVLVGYLPAGLGVPALLSLVLGLVALALIVRFVGRIPEPAAVAPDR